MTAHTMSCYHGSTHHVWCHVTMVAHDVSDVMLLWQHGACMMSSYYDSKYLVWCHITMAVHTISDVMLPWSHTHVMQWQHILWYHGSVIIMSCYTGSICHVWCHVTMALHTMPCYHGSTCHVWCHATMEIWCQAARNIIVLWGLKSLDPISKTFFFKYGYSFRTWNFTKICTLQAKQYRFFLYTSYIITEDGRFIDFTSSQYFKFNTWHMSLV